jgi:hypothetical protein
VTLRAGPKLEHLNRRIYDDLAKSAWSLAFYAVAGRHLEQELMKSRRKRPVWDA